MNRTVWRRAICLWLTAWAGLAQATGPAAFRYVQDVSDATVAAPRAVAVALDEEAWAELDERTADLRLFDDAGTPVPYLLRRATDWRAQSVPTPVRARVADLKTLEANAIEILLELKENEPPADRLTIETPLKNFERRVSVQGKAADGDWESLVEDALVYDYARFMDVRQTEIALPRNRARRLRVAIADVTDEQRSALARMTRRRGAAGESVEESYDVTRRPFRIDRIALVAFRQAERAQAERRRVWPIAGFETKPDAKTGETVVEIAMNRVPVGELTLRVADDNFFRDATVEVPARSEGREVWRPVASGRLHRVRLGGQERESLTLSFSERRAERFRIRVRNNDNPPLTVEGAEAKGPVYEAVFVAEPDRNYRLHYGATGLRAPVYDMAAILSAAGAKATPVVLEAGPRRDNPLWEGRTDASWVWLQSRTFFFAAVAAALAALTVGIALAMRRADAEL